MAEKIVSLDVGSSSLRAIEAEVRNNEPKITKIFSMPIPGQIVESGRVLDEKSLVEEIGRLWKTAKLTAKKVIVTVGGQALQMRVVNNMPWSPDKDFKNMLPYTLRDKIPLEIEDYYFDSHTLSESRNPDDLLIYKRILLTAANKTYVDAIVAALEANKLRVLAVDAIPTALIRAHHIAYDYKPNTVVASMDIGAETFTIQIHKNHQPIHQHIASNLGGNRITERIAKELKVTNPEAELLKVTSGYPIEKVEGLTTVVPMPNGLVRTAKVKDFTDFQKQAVQQIIAEEVSLLIAHINEILDDFFATSVETTLHEVVLSGGGIMINGFVPRIAAEFMTPKVAKPFGAEASKKVGAEIIENQHQFMVALGALISRNGY
jgi:type IV pilus assembly protein PilM